ncbi:tryptophan--tRNA ligase [Candidatus Phytoplasma melaleucae]|uniref:Tryptophan--tRNA ligase n=1 Tax=Candidatus Phytoplasma melaleucae TaxID=2982630 RepID=A0ABT9DEK8_9MOLU|nr:tryptophan--tRNA ligase ['Melaleuca sp.' phytoplasma]MDO8168006.1 tryptophan--tRNA ligase ['Melaleuca sp.' phytoplasma]
MIMQSKLKKKIITGIKPTGKLTLGNLLGVIRPLVLLQKKFYNKYDFYIFIADLHSLTFFQTPSLLKQVIKDTAALCLAAGLDLSITNLFIQSEVPQHTYLSYIMECTSYLGELSRMIQFKEKKKYNSEPNVRTSLFTYPILMAADILLYDADIVVVGQDQKQHLELVRSLAIRFNSLYGNTFIVPDFLKIGHTINSLINPIKKMNKSDHLIDQSLEKGCIFLSEDLNLIRKKIMQSVTDSDNEIKYDTEKKPGLSNLLKIYSAFRDWDLNKTEAYFQGYSYQNLKIKVADLVIEHLSVIQNQFHYFRQSSILANILSKSAEKSSIIAQNKLDEVKKKLGIGW